MRAYEDWVIEAETKGLKISGVILQDQIEELEQSEEALMQRMSTNLKVMRESVAAGLIGERRSLSGLVGGDAVKVESYRKNGASLVGEVMSGAISKARA